MKNGMVKLIWKPENPLVQRRQPTPMSWKNVSGTKDQYFPDLEDDGDWYIEVPFGLAAFTLGLPASNWKLWEPQELRFEAKTGLGVYKQKKARSVKPGPKNPEPAHLKAARESKKNRPKVTSDTSEFEGEL